MSSDRPMPFVWTGSEMRPRQPSRAAGEYDEGEIYFLVRYEPRSHASHNHFFGSVADLWSNLPESIERFATPDHLRKYALIKSGWHDERSIACASRAEALRVASFIRPMDEYAIVTVTGSLVTVYTAKSQSMKAMGKADFQKSKDDVLGVISALIGVAPVTSPELVPA